MELNKKISRRSFMKTVTVVAGGLIGFGIGIPAVRYILGPSLKNDASESWIRLGAISKVESGIPVLFKIKLVRQSGWVEDEEDISVYVYTENGRDFLAMSNICTHLGCRVPWNAEQGDFPCPCHAGFFDKQGYVISGPPPRPLDIYPIKPENDELWIQPTAMQRVG